MGGEGLLRAALRFEDAGRKKIGLFRFEIRIRREKPVEGCPRRGGVALVELRPRQSHHDARVGLMQPRQGPLVEIDRLVMASEARAVVVERPQDGYAWHCLYRIVQRTYQ